jgi:hypothetical protein
VAVLTNPLYERFEAALRALPAPGGNGCHPALLGAANYGAMAGLDEDEIVVRLAASVPQGSRSVSERELRDAARRAVRDHALRLSGGRISAEIASQQEPCFDACRFMLDYVKRGSGLKDADIAGLSDVAIPTNPADHANVLFDTLYGCDEDAFLFIGELRETRVRTVKEWRKRFAGGSSPLPHIVPNTLSGAEGLTKDGFSKSFRADSCVSQFRFCVAEFDSLPRYLLREGVANELARNKGLSGPAFPRDWQLAFWATVPLPVVALIDSGGKSIHAWLRVDDCDNSASWEQAVERRLYADFLVPLGVDPACRNEARLSRMPGHFRRDRGQWQRLLYLNPQGRPVCES